MIVNSFVIAVLFSFVASFSNAQYSRCGVSSKNHLVNFDTNINNTNPVVFPRTEAELISILNQAKAGGCKLRVRGSGHSNNGLITQNNELNSIVVHLGKFQSGWANSLNNTNCVATIQAGDSYLELMTMARPRGCVMKTHTAYPMFTVGGVIANHVTGNGHAGGMLYDDVVAVRVLLGTGEIRDVTSEPELRFFRGAFGLTGIILAVKIQMTRDLGVSMSIVTSEYDLTNAPEMEFPRLMNDQMTMVMSTVGSDCYLDPYPNQLSGKQTLKCYTETVTGTPYFGRPQSRAAAYRARYKSMLDQPFNYQLAYRGNQRVHFPSPCALVPMPYCMSPLMVAAISFQGTHQMLDQNFVKNSQGMNDGFFAQGGFFPEYRAYAYFLKSDVFAQALGAYLQLVAPFMLQGDSADWLPNSAFEWRIVTPRGTSAFDTLTPGQTYFQIEVLNSFWAMKTSESERSIMMQLEQVWLSMGAIPHMAKYYGMDAQGKPFQNPFPFYTPEQIATVQAYLDQVDPTRVLSAGSSLYYFDQPNYVPYTE